MNNRFKKIRLLNGLSQEEFGKKIGIESRAHISSLEKGNRNITDRIVNDVCRVFNINEIWLRTGEGSMEKPLEDKLSAYVSEITDDDDEFIKDFIITYMELDQSSKDALKKVMNGMLSRKIEREQH